MGSIAPMDPKLPSKCRDVSLPSPPTPSSKSFFLSDRPEPSPPPLNVMYIDRGKELGFGLIDIISCGDPGILL